MGRAEALEKAGRKWEIIAGGHGDFLSYSASIRRNRQEFQASKSKSGRPYPYSMGRTRIYDNVGKSRSGRKRAGHRRERLAQPLAIKRLDHQGVHAGGERGLAVFRKGIGGERHDAGRPLARRGLGGPDAAGGGGPAPRPGR